MQQVKQPQVANLSPKSTKLEPKVVSLQPRKYDGFIDLSKICQKIDCLPIEFLADPSTLLALRYLSKSTSIPDECERAEEVVRKYPKHLIWNHPEDPRSKIWVAPELEPILKNWLVNYQQQNWQQGIEPDAIYKCVHEAGLANYHTFVEQKTLSLNIEEKTGFCQIPTNNKNRNLQKYLTDVAFILALETIAHNTIGISQFIKGESTSKSIFEQYRQLFRVIQIEDLKIKIFFVDPRVLKIYSQTRQSILVQFKIDAIQDWQCRHQKEKLLWLTTFAKSHLDPNDINLLAPAKCYCTLYETKNEQYVKVTNETCNFQFIVDLSKPNTIYLRPELLNKYGWGQSQFSQTFIKNAFSSDREMGKTDLTKRLLHQTIAIQILSFDNNSMKFGWQNQMYTLKKSCSLAKAIKEIVGVQQQYIDPQYPLASLVSLGYKSQIHQNAVKIKEYSGNNDHYKIFQINDQIKIKQRKSDCFVSATASCRDFGKNVEEWLKLPSTWNLFEQFDQKSVPPSKFSKPIVKKYLECFPEWIEQKQGHPQYSGGTWIDGRLLPSLLNWLTDKEYNHVAMIIDTPKYA